MTRDNPDALLFLGNRNIAPVIHVEAGEPVGLAVDMVRAMARHMDRPVEIKAVDWKLAQSLVASGEADALIQINATPERRRVYDFSEPFLESHFAIFVRADETGIGGISSLRGRRVGVEAGGLPQQLLSKDPQVQLQVIPDFPEGFQRVGTGKLDAVVVDYRVGSYVIATSGFTNIRAAGDPIQSSFSAIAVRKGNTALLNEINAALRAIKSDGTYDKILEKWAPTEGIFETRAQITQRTMTWTMAVLLVLLLVAVMWGVSLSYQMKRKKVAEAERLAAEGEAHTLASTLRAISDSAEALVFSTDTEYRYTSFNGAHASAMQALYGATIELGHSVLEYVTVEQDREEEKRGLDQALSGEHVVEAAYSGEEPSGRRFFSVSHTPVRDDTGDVIGVAVLAQDLTERKRADEVLRESEARFEAAFHASPDLIAVTRIDDGKIIEVNDGYTEMLGYTREESVGKTTGELSIWVDPEDRASFISSLRATGAVTDFETKLRRKDGTELSVIDSARTLKFDGAPAVLSVARDITERLEAEQALQRLNRELSAISECNEAMIRARDEQQLLEEICRLICEGAGYPLAWVGYAENDGVKSVRPVAVAGPEREYAASANISWSEDSERGAGPAGIAIRTGETVYSEDFATDPRLAPWLESAEKAGLRSAIALPLKDDRSRVFGVLLIYGRETNPISPDEIRLLEELASDLAFGVTALRARVESESAQAEARRVLLEMIQAIALTVEKRDLYTAGHQKRVAELASRIAAGMGLDDATVEGVLLGATIHDIGKVHIPAEILAMPRALTEVEMQLIRTHPNVGAEIVSGVHSPWPIEDMILQHHERLDGSGYPRGLKDDEIGVGARIIAVADIVEAMSSHRPYRPSLGTHAALDEIARLRGTQLDPRAVDVCLALFAEKGFEFSTTPGLD